VPVLVYDVKLKRVGCALLQAAMGGSPGIANEFPTEHWLLAPTPDLKPYSLSIEELKGVIQYHRMLARVKPEAL